jgi:protein-disulfide isomerase
MENRIMNDDEWVNQRLQALDEASPWQPNPAAALAGLRRRDGKRRVWRRRWMWSAATTSLCAAVLLGLPAPAKCALVGVGCRGTMASVLLAPAVAAKASAAAEPAKYKESGSPAAPVVLEIYSDYECPACANFYTTVFPQFAAEYVKTGKVRIVHRDFPLPQHPYSRLAARYANAAGEMGHYDEVVMQLFSHQDAWAANGNLDASVAQVLPPGVMQQVRALVEKDAKLDDTVTSDLAIVARERINRTPSLVFIHDGNRQTVDGPPSLMVLKAFVDQLLK